MKIFRKIYRSALNWFYWKIRKFFVEDLDLNEDFYCMVCCKPVLRRVITCGKKCSDIFDDPNLTQEKLEEYWI
jgi:hypothetical protein